MARRLTGSEALLPPSEAMQLLNTQSAKIAEGRYQMSSIILILLSLSLDDLQSYPAKVDEVEIIQYVYHKSKNGFCDSEYVIFWDNYLFWEGHKKVKKMGVVDLYYMSGIEGKPQPVGDHFELRVEKGIVRAKYYVETNTFEVKGDEDMYLIAHQTTPWNQRRKLYNKQRYVYYDE